MQEEIKIVTCPTCGGESVYAVSNPMRPFCSSRCKGVDLGAWASEEFRMSADVAPEALPSGDGRLQ